MKIDFFLENDFMTECTSLGTASHDHDQCRAILIRETQKLLKHPRLNSRNSYRAILEPNGDLPSEDFAVLRHGCLGTLRWIERKRRFAAFGGYGFEPSEIREGSNEMRKFSYLLPHCFFTLWFPFFFFLELSVFFQVSENNLSKPTYCLFLSFFFESDGQRRYL